MGDGKWLRRGGKRMNGSKHASGKSRGRRGLGASAPRGLAFEPLEDRHMLTVFVVSNTDDVTSAGATILGSLRWAVERANATGGADTIVFSDNIFADSGLTPELVEQSIENDSSLHAISLSGGQLTITESVRILGSGYRRIIVQQNSPGPARVFEVNSGDDVATSVEISGITIEGGSVPGVGDDKRGGGVLNREALTMREVRIRNNSSSTGGGGVYTPFGSLTLIRSVVENNSTGGIGGGGILNGSAATENTPSTTIISSTIHLNNANQGGGVMNRNGRLNIQNSTITANSADADMGGGVASQGNPVPEEEGGDPPPATVFTNYSNSIIFGNLATDVDRVGMTDDDPPVPLLPSITSGGYNIIGSGNVTVEGDDFIDPVDPDTMETLDQYGVDPMLLAFDFGNFGGSVDAYMLDPASPAIDAGNPQFFGRFDTRGRHFRRVYDFKNSGEARVDIGATEMQSGIFVVDTMQDELDETFSKLFLIEDLGGFPFIQTFDYGDVFSGPVPVLGEPYHGSRLGDLSLREAMDFARLNPGPDAIQFSQVLNTLDALELEDPDPSHPPTIILNRSKTLTVPFGQTFQQGVHQHRPADGPLTVGTSDLFDAAMLFPGDGDLTIEGPQGFVLEVDASGNDLNVNTQSGGGSRVFLIDDFDNANELDVSISNLTMMGGDSTLDGGGIFSRENLNLSGVTLKNNNTQDDGGALFIADGVVVIERSTFRNNRAADNGGAIDVTATPVIVPEVRIAHSTFSANAAQNRGGAIYNEGSNVFIEFSTITLNSSGAVRGSGIANINATALTTVRGTIISDNQSDIDVDFITTATNSATAATFVSLGYNVVGGGPAKTRFNQTGDTFNVFDPMLEPLLNTGGLVETHRPKFPTGMLSPLIDAGPVFVPQLITPTGAVSSSQATDSFNDANHLVDNSGLSGVPTYADYDTITHDDADATNAWATEDPMPPGGDYYEDLAAAMGTLPTLTFTLDDKYLLSDLIVWGFPEMADFSSSEAASFLIEFSVDGGTSFYRQTLVFHEISGEDQETISLRGSFLANAVRITPLDNFYDDFPGGERVGLGEVKFLTNRFDARGPGFDRVFDIPGVRDPGLRIDIGAYELQNSVFTVSNSADENDGVVLPGEFSLREAIALANANPLPDEITFEPSLIAFLALINNNDAVLTLDGFGLVPGTPADLRITDSVRIFVPIDPTTGERFQLAIDGEFLDNPSGTIDGSRMFKIDDGNASTHIDVAIEGLEFRNARAPEAGAAIWSSENLTLDGVTFSNNETILDPMAEFTGLHGGAVYQQGVQGAAVKPVLTINNSAFTANRTRDANADGAAIYVTDASLVLSNTTLSGNNTNASDSDGGAIYVRRSTFTADSTTSLTGNAAIGGLSDGGAFFAEASTVTLDGTVISGNFTQGSNSHGGGFAALNSDVTLVDARVTLNDANGSASLGGGIHATGGSLNVTRSLLQENQTHGGAGHGGGLALLGGSATLNSTSVNFNAVSGAGSHGGGLYNIGGNLVIRDSAVYDNEATSTQSKGGGVYSDTNLVAIGQLGSESTRIINSTISGNLSRLRGGGVFNADGQLEIKHSTISENDVIETPPAPGVPGTLPNVGSGVASTGNASTQTRVQSSIIAGNAGGDVDSVDSSLTNTFVSQGFNVIGTGNSLASFTAGLSDQKNVANPGLAPLVDNDNLLVFPLPTHALEAGSPAINAGSPSFNPNAFSPPLILDQRGAQRVQNNRIDVGAYESSLAPPLAGDLDGDGDVDGADFLAFQRGVVTNQGLQAIKDNFGMTQAVAASGSSFSAALEASEAAQADDAAGASTAFNYDFSSLASLGVPGSSQKASSPVGGQAVEDRNDAMALEQSFAALAATSPTKSGLLANAAGAELIALTSEDDAEAAGELSDAVFAAWGDELL